MFRQQDKRLECKRRYFEKWRIGYDQRDVDYDANADEHSGQWFELVIRSQQIGNHIEERLWLFMLLSQ